MPLCVMEKSLKSFVVRERCKDGASSVAVLREICNEGVNNMLGLHSCKSHFSVAACKKVERNKGFSISEADDLVNFEDLSVSDVVCYLYARLVSGDVERTFSRCKSLFRDGDTDLRYTS